MADSAANQLPKWNLDKDGLEPVVAALADLDYQPANFIWLAALRMARAPVLVDDLLAYIAVNQPPLDLAGRKPKMLFRILPGGYSVASLTAAFKFELVGSFLLGSELVADEGKALAMLERFKKKGRWKTLEDGRIALVCLSTADSAAHLPLPEPFLRVKKCYTALKEDLTNGKISNEAFRAAVYELRFQDSAGSWWQISDDGLGWLIWSGKAWVTAKPGDKGIQ